MTIFIFIIALVLFIMLVVVHELGHAIAARRNGVEVEEFGIGFPPRAWGRKLKNGILLSVNWLPLGGFVKLKGEHDDAKGKGAYGAARLPVKARILMAGVLINWVTAVVIFTLLALVGMPKLVDNQFTIARDTKVTKQEVIIGFLGQDSPAAKSGLKLGDRLVQLGEQQITESPQVTTLTKQMAGQKVPVIYERDGQRHTTDIQLNAENNNGKGYLGVSPIGRTVQRSTWSAPIVGAGLTVQLTGLTFQGLGQAFGNLAAGLVQSISPSEKTRQDGKTNLAQAGDSVSGPLGIFVLLKQVSGESFALVLYLIAVISLTLAVMNALPIPALDGGRLFVTLVFRTLKKPLTKEREEKIHGYGFAGLMVLVVVVTILDVKRFF